MIKICQNAPNSPTIKYNLGDQSSSSFYYNGKVLTMTFKAMDSAQRVTNIDCVCSSPEKFSFFNESYVPPTYIYVSAYYLILL